MLTQEDVAKVYHTILSIPGMNDKVKIDLKITLKNALLLNRIIQRGLVNNQEYEPTDLLDSVSEEALQELTILAEDCLKLENSPAASKAFKDIIQIGHLFRIANFLFIELT